MGRASFKKLQLQGNAKNNLSSVKYPAKSPLVKVSKYSSSQFSGAILDLHENEATADPRAN